jgi:hypothetical protein
LIKDIDATPYYDFFKWLSDFIVTAAALVEVEHSCKDCNNSTILSTAAAHAHVTPYPYFCSIQMPMSGVTALKPLLILISRATMLPVICKGTAYRQQQTRQLKGISQIVTRHVMHSTAQHSTAQHSTAQHSTAQHSTAQHSMWWPCAPPLT